MADAARTKTPRPGPFARRTLKKASSPGPLRITMLSGELLGETDARRHRTARKLATYVGEYCCATPAPKQTIRLLHAGRRLQGGRLRIDATSTVQAVFLPYVQIHDGSRESEDFRLALWNRNTSKLKKILWRPLDPNTVFQQFYPTPTSGLELLMLNQNRPWSLPALRTLLEAKAKLDRPENKDVLALAVRYAPSSHVETLLKHRADLGGSADPWRPLDIACHDHPENLLQGRPHPGKITMLLAARADPTRMLEDPTSWAQNPSHPDWSYGANPRSLATLVALACAAAAHSDPECMQQVARAAANKSAIPLEYVSDSTPGMQVLTASLCSAACTGNARNVCWLLEMRCPANARVGRHLLEGESCLVTNAESQCTALNLAVRSGSVAATQALLHAKADPNLTFDELAALDRAALHKAPATIIECILAARGEATTPTAHTTSPLTGAHTRAANPTRLLSPGPPADSQPSNAQDVRRATAHVGEAIMQPESSRRWADMTDDDDQATGWDFEAFKKDYLARRCSLTLLTPVHAPGGTIKIDEARCLENLPDNRTSTGHDPALRREAKNTPTEEGITAPKKPLPRQPRWTADDERALDRAFQRAEAPERSYTPKAHNTSPGKRLVPLCAQADRAAEATPPRNEAVEAAKLARNAAEPSHEGPAARRGGAEAGSDHDTEPGPSVEEHFRGMLAIKKMSGDGNCLFHALGENTGESGACLRALIIQYLRENAEAEEDEEQVQTWLQESQYLQSDPGHWGGDTAIIAFTRMRQQRVLLHWRTPNGDILTSERTHSDVDEAAQRGPHAAPNATEVIHLWYNGKDHYDLLDAVKSVMIRLAAA
ncbi:anks1b [Symbiodinium sp. CCMP2592]|nr:anks1b [Symbiodinium sp. CCMP2592]